MLYYKYDDKNLMFIVNYNNDNYYKITASSDYS